jgi:hypothetical protein
VASSPDDDGTSRHCQTTRVRQARWKGVTQVNQWLNSLKLDASSNLVDMGGSATHAGRSIAQRLRSRLPEPVVRPRGRPAAYSWRGCRERSWAPTPIERYMVNVGTISGSPSPPHNQCGDGQVRSRLMISEWDGGFVVVRGRESRLHGEGTQRASSDAMATAGVRR